MTMSSLQPTDVIAENARECATAKIELHLATRRSQATGWRNSAQRDDYVAHLPHRRAQQQRTAAQHPQNASPVSSSPPILTRRSRPTLRRSRPQATPEHPQIGPFLHVVAVYCSAPAVVSPQPDLS